ncbi:lipoprotein [Mycoplasma feriruminatoris]|uniref:MAG6410 family transglutaminase-related lipoprotein n=1 Tax=Mycoplasma feriruminatoris TaxID=1179777 RepID=UPI00241BF8B2|nr:transglutaminase domain-containing protein [Mycoplasma feriruminatoris]WFQ91040.1 lipoprotein [Mycoplasma feriruminatoris]
MKKLQSYLKLLSIGSVIVLAGTTISCSNINNSATRNFVIPTVNRRPNNSNSESNSNENKNNTTPENTQLVNNNQGRNHNSNNDYSHNEVIIPTDSNANNGQAFYSSISYLNHNLTELENKYIDYENKSFKEIQVNDSNIKDIILKNELPTNFYSHPQFKLNNEHIILDEFSNKEYKFKLLNTETNEEIPNEQIKWYQRISYPNSEVLESNSNDKGTFILTNDGIVKWKDTREKNSDREVEEKSARLWASYKGYLYSAVVSVYSKEKSLILKKENEARKAAKEIVKKEKWNELPTLEKLTKAYEWMTKEVKYDYGNRTGELLRSQNAYSALVEKKTVCTGYAKGFKMIMDELGIPCKFVEGDSNREESFISKHAWNLVQIDNEWYHVDTTSDRVERNQHRTEFNFFLNTNEDFVDTDTFYREFSDPGTHLRNLKFKNFVQTEEDVLTLIDNNYDVNKKQINKLELTTNSKLFKTITDAFAKRNLEVKDSKFTSRRKPNQSVIYFFNNQNIENTDINITNIEKYNNQNAIKIDFDKKIDGLKAGNFNISNAYIKKVEQKEKSYILYLEHFSKFGKVEVKLDSIKRKDYKFNLNQKDKVEFNIEKQNKPEVSVKSIDNKTIKIINGSSNLKYSFNNKTWKDVPSNFIINDATIGTLYIKHKETNDKLESDIQVIEISKFNEVNNKVKLINGDMLIGVDKTMEYKKEKDKDWTPIKETVLKNLPKDTYLIRAKANETTLASDISKVEIR